VTTTRVACGLLLGVLTAAPPAEAQTAPPVVTVGVLCVGSCPAPPLETSLPVFLNALGEAGYTDGQNLVVDLGGVGDTLAQLPMLATRLIRRKVDVIVAMGAAAVLAAKQASTTVPIVMLDVPNALELGLVASLARPGGNVTGVTFPLAELSAKHMELFKQIVPGLTSIGVLWSRATPYADLARQHAEAAARSVGVQTRSLEVREAGDLARALGSFARERKRALLIVEDVPLALHRRDIIVFALAERLPAIAWSRQFPAGGGLMSYGPSRVEMQRLAATVVAKILKGRRPADIPVEQPTRYELIVNMATAKTIGVTIPPAVLAGADEVLR
jgi:putative ABC transport system substrate-binding protein